MNRPYRNNTLASLNDALIHAADLADGALAPEQEKLAKDLAFRMAQDPSNKWRGYAGCLHEARGLVAHAVSGS